MGFICVPRSVASAFSLGTIVRADAIFEHGVDWISKLEAFFAFSSETPSSGNGRDTILVLKQNIYTALISVSPDESRRY